MMKLPHYDHKYDKCDFFFFRFSFFSILGQSQFRLTLDGLFLAGGQTWVKPIVSVNVAPFEGF